MNERLTMAPAAHGFRISDDARRRLLRLLNLDTGRSSGGRISVAVNPGSISQTNKIERGSAIGSRWMMRLKESYCQLNVRPKMFYQGCWTLNRVLKG